MAKANINPDTVAINPYKNDIDYKQWYKWWGKGKPVFQCEENNIKILLEVECDIVGSNRETQPNDNIVKKGEAG